VDNHVASIGGVGRQREVDAEGVRDVGPAGIDVHQRDAHAREPAEQTRDRAADHPGAHDRDAVTDERGGVPQGVDSGLDGAGQHGPIRRHALRHDRHGSGRDDVGGLVRVEAEDRAAAQLRRPLLHGTDAQIAVLHRPGEVALLERCAHARVLRRRHAAPEHQRLGAAADA
jgi:hypothetical protein